MRFTVLKCCFKPACEWFQFTVIFRPDGMVMIMFSYHVPIVISMSPFYYPADCGLTEKLEIRGLINDSLMTIISVRI